MAGGATAVGLGADDDERDTAALATTFDALVADALIGLGAAAATGSVAAVITDEPIEGKTDTDDALLLFA